MGPTTWLVDEIFTSEFDSVDYPKKYINKKISQKKGVTKEARPERLKVDQRVWQNKRNC